MNNFYTFHADSFGGFHVWLAESHEFMTNFASRGSADCIPPRILRLLLEAKARKDGATALYST